MMKHFNFKKLLPGLLIALFIMASIPVNAQDENQTELKDFKIIVEMTSDGIKMQSLKGSSWIDLSFSLKNYNPQAIDQNGMTKLGNDSTEKDSQGFLFTITKTEYGVEFKGIEGTAWTDLSFSLAENEKRVIDQYGTSIPE